MKKQTKQTTLEIPDEEIREKMIENELNKELDEDEPEPDEEL